MYPLSFSHTPHPHPSGPGTTPAMPPTTSSMSVSVPNLSSNQDVVSSLADTFPALVRQSRGSMGGVGQSTLTGRANTFTSSFVRFPYSSSGLPSSEYYWLFDWSHISNVDNDMITKCLSQPCPLQGGCAELADFMLSCQFWEHDTWLCAPTLNMTPKHWYLHTKCAFESLCFGKISELEIVKKFGNRIKMIPCFYLVECRSGF